MKTYNHVIDTCDAVIKPQLSKFQQRTGCFVEYTAIFGSSQRGYDTEASDSDVCFVFDYPLPTTMTLKSNLRFKVGSVEFTGISRQFFLEKLGSSSVHHWIVLLADSYIHTTKEVAYKKFLFEALGNTLIRQHLARRFLHSAYGQLQSPDYNLVRAFGKDSTVHDHVVKDKLSSLADDKAFNAIVKNNLQAIFVGALGLVLSSDKRPHSQDLLTLLKMTDLGSEIAPSVERLIDLRRGTGGPLKFNKDDLFALEQWILQIRDHGTGMMPLRYEGGDSPYASIYDPESDEKYVIHEGSDNPIRRLIVDCFLTKG